ncbi:hypothetical protein V5O48_002013 [Marasmius crinis-equi]|uniref:Homeobox domain-containing protein n=1 Tax=Marasmius crinis-equi TaxID=585013 RepID=A0ABR3FX26_9AGAR
MPPQRQPPRVNLGASTSASTRRAASFKRTPVTRKSSVSTCSEASNDYDDRCSTHSSPTDMVSSATTFTVKRKRCRVTPDQLVHLERIFANERSPDASRRREISDSLGMNERQTQIWFQNRRAKERILREKFPYPMFATCAPTEPPSPTQELVYKGGEPDPNPQAVFDARDLVNEDQDIEVIPSTDLCIGTWRRIATQPDKNDLITYICDSKEYLAWFVVCDGNNFKMVLPFNHITNAEFLKTSSGSGWLNIDLSAPPMFYMQSVPVTLSPLPQARFWRQCTDWTAGAQATHVLRHELQGSPTHLTNLARTLKTRISSVGSQSRLAVAPQGPFLDTQVYYSQSQPPSPEATSHSTGYTYTSLPAPYTGPPLPAEAEAEAFSHPSPSSTQGTPLTPVVEYDTHRANVAAHGLPRSFSAPVIYPYNPNAYEGEQNLTQYSRRTTDSPPTVDLDPPVYYAPQATIHYYDYSENPGYYSVEPTSYLPSCPQQTNSFHQ